MCVFLTHDPATIINTQKKSKMPFNPLPDSRLQNRLLLLLAIVSFITIFIMLYAFFNHYW